jgi:hypothetical protein
MGYNAPTAAIDVSNSNTPLEQDPSNSDTSGASSRVGFYRDAATMDGTGNFQFTDTGAYPGNNGRSAILNPANNTLYLTGNAGNGSTPTYQGVVVGAGSQIAAQATTSQATQDAGAVPAPTAFGNFNITQAGYAADKSTKDNNFRGLTEFNNVIYMTKGSGSNGINTVYFVDTTGNACPGSNTTASVSALPQPGASLPAASGWTAPTFSANGTNPELTPNNMCVLKGFPTGLASANSGVSFPFGMWFANSTTLYVADEGTGSLGTISGSGAGPYTYSGASTGNTGGLQKWSLVGGTWTLDYTLSNGLNLGTSYAVSNSGANAYPTGPNNTQGGAGGPWNPATDGLRNIVGRVNGDGTVSVWATTSTVSGSGDQGADPNQLVAITDNVAATTLPASEAFNQVLAPTYGLVYRGVSFTPGTSIPALLPEVPWAALIPISALAVGGGVVWFRRRRWGRALAPVV